jgi:hypothetical protein
MTTLVVLHGFFFVFFNILWWFVKELWTIMNMDIENKFAMVIRLFVLVIMIL